MLNQKRTGPVPSRTANDREWSADVPRERLGEPWALGGFPEITSGPGKSPVLRGQDGVPITAHRNESSMLRGILQSNSNGQSNTESSTPRSQYSKRRSARIAKRSGNGASGGIRTHAGPGWKPGAFPLGDARSRMVQGVGLEPTTSRLSIARSAN